jgi:hypothetical protein
MLDFPINILRSGFPTKEPYVILISRMRASYPVQINLDLVKIINFEVPYCAIFSSLMLLPVLLD